MELEELAVQDAWRVRPLLHTDKRGTFFESFRSGLFTGTTGHTFRPSQTNFSISGARVLRGMHGVRLPPGQSKYVTCVRGKVLDVVLDCRLGSPTFGRSATTTLSAANGLAVFVPDGMAHGFLSLADDSCVSYMFDTPYLPGTPYEVNPFDPELGLPWRAEPDLIVAPKDLDAPTLAEAARTGLLPDYADCLRHYAALSGTGPAATGPAMPAPTPGPRAPAPIEPTHLGLTTWGQHQPGGEK